jgi:hypothetical protein
MPICSEALEVKETFNLLSHHLVLRPLVFLKLLRSKGIQPFVFPAAISHTSTATLQQIQLAEILLYKLYQI